MVVFDESSKPYGRHYAEQMAMISTRCDSHFFVASPLGPVPMELDEMYPIAQSLFPEDNDLETTTRIKTLMERMSHEQPYSLAMAWDGQSTMDALSIMCEKAPGFDLDMARVRAVTDYQFGRGAADSLLDGNVVLRKSDTTGKIRNVLVDGEHVLSMRANDGLFTLRPSGAVRLMKGFPSPRLRVVVNEDSVPFNREGKKRLLQVREGV